ncbi:hypothetical protein [Microbacterium karelineae]|uniref:hypothetical protein n=1 Tax=Microbacterium karelineae TaxID=2654283 RepID=UPI0012E9F15E|nr:hypothetical protein [Microbacterium karelineae]
MSEFPWQKDGHRDDVFRWDRRMPWQTGDEADEQREAPESADASREASPLTDSDLAAGADRVDGAAVAEPVAPDPAPGTAAVPSSVPEASAPEAAVPEAPAPPVAPAPRQANPASPAQGPVLRPATPVGSPLAPPVPHRTTPKRRRHAARPAAAAAAAKRGFRVVPWVIGAAVALPVLFGVFGSAFDDDGAVDEAASEAAQEDIARITAEFFEAVAAADLDEALARLDVDPDDDGEYESHALLTQEVLDGISARAPLTGLSVGEVEADPDYSWRAHVEVSFRLGDDVLFSDDIEVEQSTWADAEWAVSPENFAQWMSPDMLPAGLTLEGVPIDEDNRYVLLPGVYAVDTGSDLTTLRGYDEHGGEVLLEDRLLPIPAPIDSFAGAALLPEAAEAVDAAIEASLAECAAATTLETPCGTLAADAFSGGVPVDGTLSREISWDSGAEGVALAYDDALRAESYRYIEFDVTADCSGGGVDVECTAYETLDEVWVDLSDPELPVTWEHESW